MRRVKEIKALTGYCVANLIEFGETAVSPAKGCVSFNITNKCNIMKAAMIADIAACATTFGDPKNHVNEIDTAAPTRTKAQINPISV